MAESVKELLDALAGRFDPAAWGAGDAVLLFNITGEGGGQWTITIKDDKLSVADGATGTADMTMTVDAADLVAMSKGELNPVSAFMAGKVKIDGNMSLAMKLQNLIS